MKKTFKSLLLLGSLGLVSLSLASCTGESRNTIAPYGDKYNNSDVYVAKATGDNGKEYKMSLADFYSRLRCQGYNTVITSIKGQVYKTEYSAAKELLTKENLADVSDATKTVLTLKKDDTKLFNLEDTTLDYTKALNNYSYIRKSAVEDLTDSLASSIFQSSSAKVIKAYTDEELDRYYTRYIESKARVGITITKADLAFTYPTDDSDRITFTNFVSLVDNHEDLVKSNIMSLAEKLASAQELFQIADEEYILPYDADEDTEKTKNSNFYLFDEDTIKSSYKSTIKTYATHKAVVIMYNSRTDAMNAVEKVNADLGYKLTDDLTEDDVNNYYLALYKEAYKYKNIADLTDEEFVFTVNEEKNELGDLTTQAQTLITDTLKDKEYLKEPRNLNNKYYLVYHISSVYDTSNSDEAKEYEDLTDTEKETYDTIIKYNSIASNASGYVSTTYKKRIYNLMNNDDTNDDLKIYDPLFETKYNNSYSDLYKLIDRKDAEANSNVIYSYGDYKYTVDDFYKEASLTYGNSILSNYFQLEYAYEFLDEYVDEDTKTANEEALDTAIKEFESGQNQSYDKSISTENFLLLSYGYSTKEAVLKYAFNAKACLSAYTAKSVYKSFATFDEKKTAIEGSNAYVISESAKTSFLENIRQTGNNKYSKLFNINLDHFLINLDANGDGTPDDPDEFTKDFTDAEKTDFVNAVTDLARALYIETVSGKYGQNEYFEILSYIKNAYEEGADLKMAYTSIGGATYTNWNDFKKYNFLITCEELSSSEAITETSVSNFVVPFKEYVEKVYEKVADASLDMDNYKNGVFYLYSKDADEGYALTTDATDASAIVTDANKIDEKTLCKTIFGYHVLLLLDYEKPESTKYTKKSETDYQLNLAIILDEDTDDETKNIVVYTDSLNDKEDEASFNQFFVYYIQKQKSQTSSLTSNIADLMSKLFDDAITTYTSSNFQTYLLLNKLNIQILDNDYTIKVKTYDTADGLDVEYYANLVTDYKNDSDYKTWVDGTYTWERPTDEAN